MAWHGVAGMEGDAKGGKDNEASRLGHRGESDSQGRRVRARKEPVRGWTRDSREQRTEYRVQKQRRGDGWTREGCSIRFRDSFALAVPAGGRVLPERQSACASGAGGEAGRGGGFAMDM